MTKLTKITKKQQEIIQLLYDFRFLNRIQIQSLLFHKDPKTINMWLRDLRAKGYVEWIYSTHFTEKTKPAVYYLGLNGVRYLRTLTLAYEDGETFPAYPPHELRKRYKESTRSQTYIDRCILVASCAIKLSRKKTTAVPTPKPKKFYYEYETEAAYTREDGYYHFMLSDFDVPIRPQLIFHKIQQDEDGEETISVCYLLEIFDPTLPRYRMKKRLGDYIKFLDDERSLWREKSDTDKLPVLLFVCPRLTDLIYAKRRTRKLVADIWDWDDAERSGVYFATAEKLRELGVFAQQIWEEA